MRHLYTAFIIILFISACNNPDSSQTKSLNLENRVPTNDSTINAMLAAFNEIQENLQEIKLREGKIQLSSSEIDSLSIQDQIVLDIKALNDLMIENETQLKDLNESLSNYKGQNKELKRLILNLNKQIEEKNKAIFSLNEQLKGKQLEIDQLYFKLDSNQFETMELEKELSVKQGELNKAFYTYGTADELIDKNVISKEGGFLGIGKSKSLKDQFNADYFTKVDIKEQTTFLIYAKKAELITTHPKSSYQLMGNEEQIDSLYITNPEEFWKASKYLVIVVD